MRPHLSRIRTACRRGPHLLSQKEVRGLVRKEVSRKGSQAQERRAQLTSLVAKFGEDFRKHFREGASFCLDESARGGLAGIFRSRRVEEELRGTALRFKGLGQDGKLILEVSL